MMNDDIKQMNRIAYINRLEELWGWLPSTEKFVPDRLLKLTQIISPAPYDEKN